MATTNSFQNLPPLMMQVLLHDENVDLNIAIEKRNALTKEQGDAMMGVIRKMILQAITPRELLATIRQDLKLDEVAAKNLAIDLLGERFLPMEWYLGNVQQLITDLGGDPAPFLAKARERYPEVYGGIAVQQAEQPTIELPPVEPIGDVKALVAKLDERLATFNGRAEVLLRLTGWSAHVEEAMNAQHIDTAEGEALLKQLDVISGAINTQDLNGLERQAIRRRLSKVLHRLAEMKA